MPGHLMWMYAWSVAAVSMLVLLMGVSIHLSLWSIEALLPASTTPMSPTAARIALNRQALAQTSLLEQITPLLPADVLAVLNTVPVKKIAFTHQADSGLFLILQPGWRAQWSAAAALRSQLPHSQGWQVERVGLLVRLWRPGTSSASWPTVWHSFITWPRQVVYQGSPVRPLALVFSPGDITKERPAWQLVAYWREHNQAIIEIKEQGSPKNRPSLETILWSDTSDVFQVSLPTEALGLIGDNPAVRQHWNQFLWQELGFIHTKPDIVTILLRYPWMHISLDGDTGVIGVEDSSPEFMTTAQNWVEEEERYSRLQTKPFRLPDSTLGYEKVPGEKKTVLSLQPSQPPCLGPREGEQVSPALFMNAWICRQDKRVVFGNNRQAVIDQLSDPPWRGQINVRGRFLQHLDITGVASIRSDITPQAAIVRLFLPKEEGTTKK